MFMATPDDYYPDWECLVDFFLQSGVEKLLAWVAGDWTHNHTLDLSSQSGAYDLSANSMWIKTCQEGLVAVTWKWGLHNSQRVRDGGSKSLHYVYGQT